MRERGSSTIFAGAAAKIFAATEKQVSSRISGARAGFSLAGYCARAVLRRGGLF